MTPPEQSISICVGSSTYTDDGEVLLTVQTADRILLIETQFSPERARQLAHRLVRMAAHVESEGRRALPRAAPAKALR
jgi:hypothetical protein